ncbi:MAG: AlkZ family DNA glycosylase [Anaerolineales bacterium]|nr:AlkZ family DNA glycosylase [Anaerolineales bacterium]
MDAARIRSLRLHNQSLSQPEHTEPASVVRHLVAVQAQDHSGAMWSLGLRMVAGSQDEVEAAFNDGRILRTHLLRPTWHFVLPEDIRMLLRLTAGRVHTVNGSMYRQEKLDAATFAQANRALEAALQGGQHRTREELATALEQAGIAAKRFRLAYIMMQAELEMVVCSGPRKGKQFSYALFDERVPAEAGHGSREEELARFAARYFAARGPASVQDFAYWSGLTLAEARRGLEGARDGLVMETQGGVDYWRRPAEPPAGPAQRAWLLPAYDEYGSGYKDRAASLPHGDEGALFDNAYMHSLVIEGVVAGSWRRLLEKDAVIAAIRPVQPLSAAERKLVDAAAQRYAQFLGMPAQLEFETQKGK